MSEKQNESERLLSELESLNNTLDNEAFDLDSEQPLEDLPVLKSFVEDVPVLSDRIIEEEDQSQPKITPVPSATPTEEESDPLAISDFVRQKHAASRSTPPAPPSTQEVNVTNKAADDSLDNKRKNTSRDQTFYDQASPNNLTQDSNALENNPFLPQSAKDRIRGQQPSQLSEASKELHQLLRQSAKASFSEGQGSPEYQRLRQKATTAIDEIVKTHLPRLEAELRMRLEAEVDSMIREQNK